ncbi:MAG: hypothetical protein H0V74_01935 [Chloroflexi bacterium]|nr:hypothetical protein [Chloroflexota bacterium]
MVDGYAELERRAALPGVDRGSYPDLKDPAIDLISVGAEAWGDRTKWRPEP